MQREQLPLSRLNTIPTAFGREKGCGRAYGGICDGNQGAEPLAKKTGAELKPAG